MLFGISIWGPGEALIFLCILVGFALKYSNKYLDGNPDVKDAAKKAAASKAIGLIGKWLK